MDGTFLPHAHLLQWPFPPAEWRVSVSVTSALLDHSVTCRLICKNGGTVNQDNECSCTPGYTGERCERCALGHVQEGDRCIPEVELVNTFSSYTRVRGFAGPSKRDPFSSRAFAWPFLLMGSVAALAVVLLITIATAAVRRWNSKTSRESSVRGQPDATDV
ncbi:hypothetical protein OSTOST_10927 [Ostertagia ostertagi]